MSSNVSRNYVVSDKDFNEDVVLVLQWIIYVVLGMTIEMFGIVTNIINIIVFVKQGFKDPVNISLLGLAVSDIGCLVTLMWINICYTPTFRALDLPFHPGEVNYLTGAKPHTVFIRITAWITALITLERCMCIAAPLKVKSIVTSKRVSITITCVFVVLASTVSPVYVVNRLDYKFFPTLNKTLIGMVYTKERDTVENFCFVVNNVFIPFTAFLITIIFTTILVYKLRKETQWREKSTNNGQAVRISSRNQKVAKMVVMISTLFIVCFIPGIMIFLVMSIEPEFFLGGKYEHIVITVGGFTVLFESINSSANVFIYYKMSSRYKDTFHMTFSSCRKIMRNKS